MLLQASAVAVNGRAVLLRGAPGVGKSSVALSLIDRGGVLIGDDGVTLELDGDTLLAAPPPRCAGLIEVRGVGLIDMPTCSAPVGLLIELGAKAERLPEKPAATPLLGHAVATLPFPQADWTTALRIEHALAQYG